MGFWSHASIGCTVRVEIVTYGFHAIQAVPMNRILDVRSFRQNYSRMKNVTEGLLGLSWFMNDEDEGMYEPTQEWKGRSK